MHREHQSHKRHYLRQAIVSDNELDGANILEISETSRQIDQNKVVAQQENADFENECATLQQESSNDYQQSEATILASVMVSIITNYGRL